MMFAKKQYSVVYLEKDRDPMNGVSHLERDTYVTYSYPRHIVSDVVSKEFDVGLPIYLWGKQKNVWQSPTIDELTIGLSNYGYGLVQGVHSQDPAQQLEATTQFRKLLSIERNPPIEPVIQAGVIPKFTQFLSREDYPQLQFEAAWALTNVASGTSDHTKAVIESGAVPVFVRLLRSSNDDVREQAVWALGNIAGDAPGCRDMVLESGALQHLLMQLGDQAKITMQRNATWTLSNFCRGKPQPNFEVTKQALPTLARLIHSKDEEVLTDACWALSYLSDGPNDRIQEVIQSGVCRRLVELLMHNSPQVLVPALRTVGNIVTGDDHQTQVVINCGALGCILHLFNTSHKKSIKKEACWTVSNITAGTKEQIQAVIDSGIIAPLIDLLTNADFDIKKEAAWSISNATSGGKPEQIEFLVQQGCIKPFCDLLNCHDSRIISVALEGLKNILATGEYRRKQGGPDARNPFVQLVEDADGISKIEDLQNHESEDIYDKAVNVLDTFFEAVEEDMADTVAVPGTDGAGVYQFGNGIPTNQNPNAQNHPFNFGGN
eukprot:TRINITY_DN8252_c0_g4_i2.p1 TRINITY_DN8252_c0_g4~~TRINITY_DN8252_c0_g4_i2.p1  ORF type:complete len:601 (-),score=72.78 TRINITY_DN8252_c0_g4_i2:293-1936(-)